jgi:tripartite-type tricarboxylate transporter receptor subunit TctC
MQRTTFIRFAAAVAALAPAASLAQDHTWPSGPIHVIVPFTAGSTTDIIARAVSDKLATQLAQPVVVENRAGAGGTIGAAVVAKSEPNGYTILIHSSSHTANPATFTKLPFDTERDFTGVTPIAAVPQVLVIAPSKGIKSVAALVARAKAKPGTMTYASAGAGSATHLNAEKFRIQAGFEGVHVPFKGSPEAITEVMMGRVDFYFSPVAPVLGYIKEGKLLALAVGSPRRSSVLPDVPTTVEAGVAGSEFDFWVGLLVPAKTPRAIVNRLHQEMQKILSSPQVKERFAGVGAEAMLMTPEQFNARIRDEIAANSKLVKVASIPTQ